MFGHDRIDGESFTSFISMEGGIENASHSVHLAAVKQQQQQQT